MVNVAPKCPSHGERMTLVTSKADGVVFSCVWRCARCGARVAVAP
jgi:hypothetical protein